METSDRPPRTAARATRPAPRSRRDWAASRLIVGLRAMRATKTRSRMDAVQAPIVQVIGDLIQEVPGTISLGQGVVHYGPPAAALDAVRASLADPSTHEYQNGDGLPALVERLAEKLRTENGIDLARGSRVMVTAGANMA